MKCTDRVIAQGGGSGDCRSHGAVQVDGPAHPSTRLSIRRSVNSKVDPRAPVAPESPHLEVCDEQPHHNDGGPARPGISQA